MRLRESFVRPPRYYGKRGGSWNPFREASWEVLELDNGEEVFFVDLVGMAKEGQLSRRSHLDLMRQQGVVDGAATVLGKDIKALGFNLRTRIPSHLAFRKRRFQRFGPVSD